MIYKHSTVVAKGQRLRRLRSIGQGKGDAVQFALMNRRGFVLLLFSYVIRFSGPTWLRSRRVEHVGCEQTSERANEAQAKHGRDRPLAARSGDGPGKCVFPPIPRRHSTRNLG